MALEQARHLIGYDKEKGITRAGYNCRRLNIRNENGHVTADLIDDSRQEDMIDNCDAFSALTFYLIALDQLGHLFVKKSKRKSVYVASLLEIAKTNEFSDEGCRMAVENLRNSLCHSFGLVNMANSKNCFCKFTLDFTTVDKIIQLPTAPWNGDWEDKSEATQIEIGVFPLCNAIEKVIVSIVEQYKRGEIPCSIENNEELKTRFTIVCNS